MPAKKPKKRCHCKGKAVAPSYPKGYKRVSRQTLAADRKKHPNGFPASLVRRKMENAAKRTKKA